MKTRLAAVVLLLCAFAAAYALFAQEKPEPDRTWYVHVTVSSLKVPVDKRNDVTKTLSTILSQLADKGIGTTGARLNWGSQGFERASKAKQDKVAMRFTWDFYTANRVPPETVSEICITVSNAFMSDLSSGKILDDSIAIGFHLWRRQDGKMS